MSYAIAPDRELRPTDGYWLLAALVLHAAILLIPIHEDPTTPSAGTVPLIVRLFFSPEQGPAPTDAEHEESAQPIRTTPQQAVEPADPQPTDVAPAQIRSDSFEPQEPTSEVSAAHLIGLRESVAKQVPLEPESEISTPGLGALRPIEVPENWKPGTGAEALAPFDNVFNGKTVPVEVEVVDRWLAADGSHHVVVETPAGLRLCGRAKAWDPARPLVEFVMQYKICGGDGQRSFRYSPRKRLDRSALAPVAKETTPP